MICLNPHLISLGIIAWNWYSTGEWLYLARSFPRTDSRVNRRCVPSCCSIMMNLWNILHLVSFAFLTNTKKFCRTFSSQLLLCTYYRKLISWGLYPGVPLLVSFCLLNIRLFCSLYSLFMRKMNLVFYTRKLPFFVKSIPFSPVEHMLYDITIWYSRWRNS